MPKNRQKRSPLTEQGWIRLKALATSNRPDGRADWDVYQYTGISRRALGYARRDKEMS